MRKKDWRDKPCLQAHEQHTEPYSENLETRQYVPSSAATVLVRKYGNVQVNSAERIRMQQQLKLASIHNKKINNIVEHHQGVLLPLS